MQFTFQRLAAAAVLALAPALASAAPVTLTYISQTADGQVSITAAPVVTAKPLPAAFGAYGFNMNASPTGVVGDAAGNFVAWCLDLEHYLAGTSGYITTTTPFTNSYGLSLAEIGRVQRVFEANYAGLVTSDDDHAGFQTALWNAVYDTDWLAGVGTFAASGTAAVVAKADAFLAAASAFAGPNTYNLTFLESTDRLIRQNLITVSPVPLPAAGWLLIVGLGGLAALRRKRKAA